MNLVLTQQDPIGLAGGLNLYGFASGDPVNFSDPFGDSVRVQGPWSHAVLNYLYERAGSFRQLYDQLHADPTVNLTVRDPVSDVELYGVGSQFLPGQGRSGTILFNANMMNQANLDLLGDNPRSRWVHTAASVMAHEFGHAGGKYGFLPAGCANDPSPGRTGCVVRFENKVRRDLPEGERGGFRSKY